MSALVAPQEQEQEQQPEHPKALAARLQAQQAREEKARRRADLRALAEGIAEDCKLQFIDLTPRPDRLGQGMTVAYNGRSVLRVSTSIRNPADKYDKLRGRAEAANAFEEGRYIYLRKPSNVKAATFLRLVFAY
jgi:hypothetical protein